MTIVKHELRRSKTSLLIWTVSIGFLMAICIFLFPEMKTQMEGVSEMFASMGSFTQAFGMDRLSFGTLTGFYAIECGNILGLGGALFAALCAIQSLAGEERDHTAEFLMTHPVSRWQVVALKLLAVVLQITMLNGIILLLSLGCVAAIGEEFPWKELGLLHLAFFLLQLELAGICFGVSAFLRRSGAGVGLGLAVLAYFLNLIANISEKMEFLRFVTPFSYAEGADIITQGNLDWGLVLLGMGYALAAVAAAFWYYGRKDLT